jgi:hypothetical protein
LAHQKQKRSAKKFQVIKCEERRHMGKGCIDGKILI